ncbi:MAG: hypothetical protein AB9919_06985 [Geobacteraceae bacterium]
MGSNFHTPYTETVRSRIAEMNPPLAALDKQLTYQQNRIIHCDGDLSYDKATGVLSWSATLRILFNSAAGLAIQNTVATGSITLADNEFCYVTLSETNDAALTAAKAAVTTAAASNFLALGRLVLAYRNTASDDCYAVGITHPIRKIEAHIADAKTDYTIGDLDTESEIIAAFNATNGKINSILAILEAQKLTASS